MDNPLGQKQLRRAAARSSLFLSALLFFPSIAFAAAATAEPTNYEWWAKQSAPTREAAVVSAAQALRAGWAIGYAQARGEVQDGLAIAAHNDPKAYGPALDIARRYPGGPMPEFSQPASYYRKRLDHFYAVHKHARAQSIIKILDECLRDVPVHSCDVTAKESPQ